MASATAAPLRGCLLSGGESRRMGRDKALLPHPNGGTWLEGNLRLLAGLGAPLTLITRHPRHGEIAAALAPQLGVPLTLLLEPPPWEGPLLSLHRLFERHADERLLLCPVDMPWLQLDALQALRASAEAAPGRIHAAHDGERLQPLLGLYPADDLHRRSLAAFLAGGGRALQAWLAEIGVEPIPLAAAGLANCNRREDWTGPWCSGDLPSP